MQKRPVDELDCAAGSRLISSQKEKTTRDQQRRARAILAAAVSLSVVNSASATPSLTTASDGGGTYYLVNNSAIQFKVYKSGSSGGKITSITFDGQQMVGTKGIYSDLEGSPNIYLGSGETYTTRTGANFIDIAAEHPASATEPLDVTWHWILKDGEPGYHTYLTYHHTTAMADWNSSENRLVSYWNSSLFTSDSITSKFWQFQPNSVDEGRFITAETSDMRGIPSEYTKNYQTKYDTRDTYQNSDGDITGRFTAANTSIATAPLIANDYGVWNINNYRTNESENAGPTHPQTGVGTFVLEPSGAHFGGPGLLYTGNVDKAFGPFFTYFNKGSNINALRADAVAIGKGTSPAGAALNSFYDSLNLPYYATSAQRGIVNGKARTTDGTNMDGATIILSSFDAAGYAASPLSQEYQRRAAGYNYWVNPAKDGSFSLPDVRPGNYRITIIKPGNYREATFDNITVSAGGVANVGNLTFNQDVGGKGVFGVGTFDRTAAEFHDGDHYNNWIDTFNYAKEFPNGINYTVDNSNPFNDTQNWRQNWGLDQQNGNADFWKVNFKLAQVPAANSTFTVTVAIAAQEFINDLGVLIGSHRVDAGFDHTNDTAPSVNRSGDTSSKVLYRKLSFPASWLANNTTTTNTLNFHIVGGEMQWDALRLDVTPAGTSSFSQWNGGSGNWSDGAQWGTQAYGFSNVNKGLATINGVANPEFGNDTSTTFADGATHTAPINNAGSQLYFDATLNGGTITLDTSPAVQKLNLLEGSLTASGAPQTITANDAVVLGGATVSGTAVVTALTTTTLNFSNTISAGGTINSTGAVNWLDGGSMTVTGAGSQWTVPGMSYGQAGINNSLTVSAGAVVAAGANAITAGPSSTTNNSGAISAASLSNAGALTSTGTITLTGALTNSGAATIATLNAGSVSNTAGLLVLNGVSSYNGGASITGGAIQFASSASIGGTGANVVVGPGGAASYSPGITDATFLSRISPSSSGALALTSVDSATALDFTAAPLSGLAAMAIGAVGNVTYSGVYTPAAGIYRLGGGGGTLTYSPAITGSASLIAGNTGSSGVLALNAANSFTGPVTINSITLTTAALTNGGSASGIGASSNAASNLTLNGGTLQYTGAAVTTDRLFTLGASGGTLDASGAGAINFNNSGAMATAGTGNRTLTLTGTSTVTNILSAAIGDPATGTTALTKTGSGTWALGAGAKTYSGDSTVLAGTLQLAAGGGLPSGAGKGNLVIATTGTFDLAGQAVSINGLNDGPAGPITPSNPNGWASANGPGGGSVTNSGAIQVLTLGNNNAAGLFSGVIGGTINLVKNGTGTQILSGDNTYTGTTTITGGILQVGIGGIPSSLGPGDGGFRGKLGAGNIINNATLTFNRGYLTTATNVISGSGTLKQIANAELVLGGANTYTGPTLIGQGIANIGLGGPNDAAATYNGLAFTGDCSLNASVLANGGVASSIGSSSNLASNLILDGGTLYYTGATASTDRLFTVTQNGGAIYAGASGSASALTFSNAGAIVFTGTGDRTLSLEGETSATCTFGSAIGNPTSGKTFLTKDRSNTWALAAGALLTYSGDTNMNMGVLKMGAANQLPFGAGKGNVIFATITDFTSTFDPKLELNGFDLSINGLSGGVATYGSVDNNVGVHILSVGNNNATATFNAIITGGINFVKVGSGTQTLNGVSTYTGTTTARGGVIIALVANGGVASGIGASSNAAANLVFDGGTLSSTASTDRLFTLTANGGVLDSSGANTTTFSFTNSGAVAMTAGASPTLTLTGSNTTANSIAPAMANPTGGTLSILKSGAGTWAFSSSNTKTYGGDTHITAGILEASAASAFSPNSNMVIDAGAILDLNNQTTESIGALIGAGSVNNSNSGAAATTFTIGSNNAGGTFTGIINSAGVINLIKNGSGTQVLTAANVFPGSAAANGGVLTVAAGSSLTATSLSSGAGATLNLLGTFPATAALTSSGVINIGPRTTGSGIAVRTIASATLNSGGNITAQDAALHANRTVLVTGALTFAGSTGAWAGQLDLKGNDLIVHGGSVGNLTDQLKQGFNAASSGFWNGTAGIISSTAAADSTHLTTLGVLLNNDGTGATIYSTFDGQTVTNTDALVKYTYFGDADLSGKVDGTDYSKIDNGFNNHLVGWFNGDFNYDGIVDGSDYSLIDNAFNTQGASLGGDGSSASALVTPIFTANASSGSASTLTAASTAELAANSGISAVPEPGTMGLLGFASLALLNRRRRNPSEPR